MNKKSKIVIGVVAAVIAVGAAGALMYTILKPKTAATVESFQQVAADKGYESYDMTSDYESYDTVTSAILAQDPENTDMQVEFYVLDNEQDASDIFDVNKSSFDTNAGDNNTKSSKSVSNYETYTVKDDNQYMYICRVDNTMVYIQTSVDNMDAAKAFTSELGY